MTPHRLRARPLTSPLMCIVMAAGCAPRLAVRDAAALYAEVRLHDLMTAELSDRLADAAPYAPTPEVCAGWLETATIGRAAGPALARRSLWLAGLPYPEDDGTRPPIGTRQPDPGPIPEIGPTDLSPCEVRP